MMMIKSSITLSLFYKSIHIVGVTRRRGRFFGSDLYFLLRLYYLCLCMCVPMLYIPMYIYWYIYGIHNWRIVISSYRKLAWVGFEPTTTELRSDALTDWAIRPWVQLALRANFVQLLQFHPFVQCSRFISVFALVSRHICF